MDDHEDPKGDSMDEWPMRQQEPEPVKNDGPQSSLFDEGAAPAPEPEPSYPLYDGTPPHESPGTSLAAAEEIKPVTGKLQKRVLEVITERGERGATDDEIEELTGLKHQTASARRRELYLLGRIRSTGTRATRSGRKAKVWVIA